MYSKTLQWSFHIFNLETGCYLYPIRLVSRLVSSPSRGHATVITTN